MTLCCHTRKWTRIVRVSPKGPHTMSASPFPILTNTTTIHSHPHEDFSSAAGLEAILRQTVRGEVRFDAASRALYATDASNYRQVPIGLVVPSSVDDVIATMAACR